MQIQYIFTYSHTTKASTQTTTGAVTYNWPTRLSVADLFVSSTSRALNKPMDSRLGECISEPPNQTNVMKKCNPNNQLVAIYVMFGHYINKCSSSLTPFHLSLKLIIDLSTNT